MDGSQTIEATADLELVVEGEVEPDAFIEAEYEGLDPYVVLEEPSSIEGITRDTDEFELNMEIGERYGCCEQDELEDELRSVYVPSKLEAMLNWETELKPEPEGSSTFELEVSTVRVV